MLLAWTLYFFEKSLKQVHKIRIKSNFSILLTICFRIADSTSFWTFLPYFVPIWTHPMCLLFYFLSEFFIEKSLKQVWNLIFIEFRVAWKGRSCVRLLILYSKVNFHTFLAKVKITKSSEFLPLSALLTRCTVGPRTIFHFTFICA